MGLLQLTLIISFPLFARTAPVSERSSFSWHDADLLGTAFIQEYATFDLNPPHVYYDQQRQCDPSFTFITPKGSSATSSGPVILDSNGELIWMNSSYGFTGDLRVQQYQGDDYLTFWAANNSGIYSSGSYHMLNSSYDVVHEITPVGDVEGSMHDFSIINDRALITLYQMIPTDLTSLGGSSKGWIYDGLFQEIDIETGELLFQWRASDHFNITDSFLPLSSQDAPFDYFRLDSIDKDDQGNYYVSSRHTHTVACVRPNGSVKWLLGGKHNRFNDLSSGAATNFSWQHHVRWHPNDIITLFDNGAYDEDVRMAAHSRGIKLQLDTKAMTATLLQDYTNTDQTPSYFGGSMQLLPNGNAFIDWGSNAAYTEFSSNGSILCNGRYGPSSKSSKGTISSYRGFKSNWVGTPNTWPDVAMRFSERPTLYASWNGATEIRHWKLEAADYPDASDEEFAEVAMVEKKGFETAITVPGRAGRYVRMVALDQHFEVLGYSDALDKTTGRPASTVWLEVQDDDIFPLQHLMVACVLVTLFTVAWNMRKKYTCSQNDYYDDDEDDDDDDDDKDDEDDSDEDSILDTKPDPIAKSILAPPLNFTDRSRWRYLRYKRQGTAPAVVPSTITTLPVNFKHQSQSRYAKFRRQAA